MERLKSGALIGSNEENGSLIGSNEENGSLLGEDNGNAYKGSVSRI